MVKADRYWRTDPKIEKPRFQKMLATFIAHFFLFYLPSPYFMNMKHCALEQFFACVSFDDYHKFSQGFINQRLKKSVLNNCSNFLAAAD